jgi:uncharacterized protein (DUF58 family)
MYLFRKQRDANGLVIFSDKIDFFSEAKLNDTHFNYLLTQLQNLLESYQNIEKKQTNLTSTLHTIADRIPKRSLITIFSDLLTDSSIDDIINALQHLRYNKHEIIIFNVIDQNLEINFDFDNRPYKFVDIETGQQIKVNPVSIRESYKKEISNYFNELHSRIAQLKIDFVPVDINKDFSEVLITYLLKRQKLY